MIKVTRINDQNRSSFLPAADALTLAVCDLLFGAYDDKTDTACGILAAESENNDQAGYTLAIRQIYVDEGWRRRGVGTALVNALADFSNNAGAKALLESHLEVGGKADDISLFLEALGFQRTKDALPVYGFRLSEIVTARSDTDCSCVPLKSLGTVGWREFVKRAYERSVLVNVRSYYEESISHFVYDSKGGFRGALLCSRRGGVLYADELLITGSKLNTLEILLYHSVQAAKTICSPGTEIGITLRDPEQESILKELTEFRAEKIGRFTAHVLRS